MPAPLLEESDKQRIKFSKKCVAVEFPIFVRVFIWVWNGGLAERKTESNSAQKIGCEARLSGEEPQSIRGVFS